MTFHRLLNAAHGLKTTRRNADRLLDHLNVQACEGDTSDCYDNDPYDVPKPVGGPPQDDPETMKQKEPSTTSAESTLMARILNAFAGPLTAAPLAIPA